MSFALIVLIAASLIALWVLYTYNFLVHARNKVREAFSGVDVQLKQRHDLVPNLIEVVRAYATHEQDALRSAAARRAEAIAANAPRQVERAENRLAFEVNRLFALAEDYPELRAAENFTRMIDEVTEIEDEIQAARALYNSNAEFYNSRAQALPASLIAGFMSPRSFAFLSFDSIAPGDAAKLVEGVAA